MHGADLAPPGMAEAALQLIAHAIFHGRQQRVGAVHRIGADAPRVSRRQRGKHLLGARHRLGIGRARGKTLKLGGDPRPLAHVRDQRIGAIHGARAGDALPARLAQSLQFLAAADQHHRLVDRRGKNVLLGAVQAAGGLADDLRLVSSTP